MEWLFIPLFLVLPDYNELDLLSAKNSERLHANGTVNNCRTTTIKHTEVVNETFYWTFKAEDSS